MTKWGHPLGHSGGVKLKKTAISTQNALKIEIL